MLKAALTIIENEGVHAVTYDALATATGMSKSGLIYHFPSATIYSSSATASAPRAGKRNSKS
ncbi:TetR/AcrR family transcriptional regulator [uncultured Corynebacterium sp.]|uniref:TetR/AcrR family transcriptional regulator n=1 Tax=uncultured Corynebacterium sp. TaxID=159447 RepID=UPI00288C2337|nr:TetR/AcrR family transcriptional regulator [uncultured Corynebacterium sp.]